MEKSTVSRVFDVYGMVNSWNLAKTYAGENGRIANMKDLISSIACHDTSFSSLMSRSSEYIGVSKTGKLLVVVCHGKGPFTEISDWENIRKSKIANGKHAVHNVIPDYIFHDLVDGKYGEVEILELTVDEIGKHIKSKAVSITSIKDALKNKWIIARLGGDLSVIEAFLKKMTYHKGINRNIISHKSDFLMRLTELNNANKIIDFFVTNRIAVANFIGINLSYNKSLQMDSEIFELATPITGLYFVGIRQDEKTPISNLNYKNIYAEMVSKRKNMLPCKPKKNKSYNLIKSRMNGKIYTEVVHKRFRISNPFHEVKALEIIKTETKDLDLKQTLFFSHKNMDVIIKTMPENANAFMVTEEGHSSCKNVLLQKVEYYNADINDQEFFASQAELAAHPDVIVNYLDNF